MSFVAKISKKGQITLPSEVRKSLGISLGSYIKFIKDGDGFRILPAEKGIEGLRGIVRAKRNQDFKTARQLAMEKMVNERIKRN